MRFSCKLSRCGNLLKNVLLLSTDTSPVEAMWQFTKRTLTRVWLNGRSNRLRLRKVRLAMLSPDMDNLPQNTMPSRAAFTFPSTSLPTEVATRLLPKIVRNFSIVSSFRKDSFSDRCSAPTFMMVVWSLQTNLQYLLQDRSVVC